MNKPKSPIPYIIFLMVMLNIYAYLFAACLAERQTPSYTTHGIARDTIYSVDYRGNGVIIIWATHSEDGYCFSDKEKVDQAEDLIRHHNGEVLIDYESQIKSLGERPSAYDPKALCYLTEVTGTVYLGHSIVAVPSRSKGE
jgi:hypothetical protein